MLCSIHGRGWLLIKQYKIGIYDDEQAYMMGLMSYINSDMDSPLYAVAFSGMDKLEEYLDKKDLELLIMPEIINIPDSLKMKLTDIKKIYLTENKESVYSNTSDECYVFKYVRAGLIAEQAADMLKTKKSIDRRRIYHTYAVISPIGRCGKTRLAKGICFLDEVRGGLYIGMEAFGSNKLSKDTGDVLSNIFYLVKNRASETMEYIQEHVVKDNDIACIYSTAAFSDINQICADDLFWLFEKLDEWGRYTTIVCDIDIAALKDISCLEAFDYIYMPVLSDEISGNKKEAFYSLLKSNELSKLMGRIREVELPNACYNSSLMIRTIERMLAN
ncbi:MAG: hypothetical protein ACI4EF_09135 [Coprococcus sp.]